MHLSPVVIVGNGPVGQTAALLLAQWSIPVVGDPTRTASFHTTITSTTMKVADTAISRVRRN